MAADDRSDAGDGGDRFEGRQSQPDAASDAATQANCACVTATGRRKAVRAAKTSPH